MVGSERTSTEGTPLSRRALLAGGAGLLAAAPLGNDVAVAVSLPARKLHELSPGRDGVVVVDRPVLVARSQEVRGIRVAKGGELVFHPRRSLRLRVRRNLVVLGNLVMAPDAGRFRHMVEFHQVNERTFVGGGEKVLGTDPGLWVMGRGRMDLRGTPKSAWVRAAGDVRAGTRRIKLAERPTGWRKGDVVVITPTLPVRNAKFDTAYDTARVKAVEGRTVVLSTTTRNAHPVMRTEGLAVAAQVLNLTRNVVVSGRPGGRSHIMVHAMRRQRIRYAELAYMGPRQPDAGYTKFVPGRYALHLHMMGGASRGTEVTGVSVHHSGSHSFVPHTSHGITFTSCIAHNVFEDAFWWDGPAAPGAFVPQTHDTTYRSCVASWVRSDPDFRGYRLSGFTLGAGSGNRAVQCTAVGVQGNREASGFHWPGGSDGVWEFSHCASHNNRCHGIFAWQNDGGPHLVERYIGSRNGLFGVMHGAYSNGYTYRDLWLVGNGTGGFNLLASSKAKRRLSVRRLFIDGEGRPGPGIRVGHHNAPAGQPTVIRDVYARRYGGAFLTLDEKKGGSDRGNPSDLHLEGVNHDDSVDAVSVGHTFPGSRIRWLGPHGELLVVDGSISGATPVPDTSARGPAAVRVNQGSPLR